MYVKIMIIAIWKCLKKKVKIQKFKMLKFNLGEKSRKSSLIIYADRESLLEKIDTCHSNVESHQ